MCSFALATVGSQPVGLGLREFAIIFGNSGIFWRAVRTFRKARGNGLGFRVQGFGDVRVCGDFGCMHSFRRKTLNM